MDNLRTLLDEHLDADGRAWLDGAHEALAAKGSAHLPILLPQLARTLGRDALTGAPETLGDRGRADLSAWRRCDLAGTLLIAQAEPDDDLLRDLYWHGDMEEKTIVLRSLPWRPITKATVDLLGEIQRTNVAAHFEAGALDHDLIVRAVAAGHPQGADSGGGFTQDDFHRLVLKMAFLDLPVSRLVGGLERATPELSRMLQDFATEREAAGRVVWVDTWRFLGRAPTDGSVARILGGLEHGADPIRRAAAEALRDLGDPSLRPYAVSRLAREPRADIRDLLAAAPA